MDNPIKQDTLVVLGAGGHGKVVADILVASGEVVGGFVDDRQPVGLMVLGSAVVVGPVEWLRSHRCRVALGIGDNHVRSQLAQTCLAYGCELATAIHPRAVVALSATIADGVVVMASAVVNPCASLHRGAIVNTAAIVEHDCVLGAFSHLSPNATLGGACRVGELAHVGIGVVVLPSLSIGARTIIGGGAVVTRDIPADVVAVGIPARARRTL